ncbi:hypothetical protein ADL00_03935 [Streptomyces sp. AS58]|nr:hypothetical protein ADL00_03935 [Streptomyces sp. AS58]
MPESAPAVRVCRTRDGLPAAAIAADIRRLDGNRVTIRVACPVHRGSGHTTRIPRRRVVTGA